MLSTKKSKYNLALMIFPLLLTVLFTVTILVFPDSTENAINNIKDFLGNKLSFYYIIYGAVFVLLAVYLSFSKYGKIKLGDSDKPKFSTFSWSTMIFTSTLAADIMFYALHEWTYYWNYTPLDFERLSEAEKVTWSMSYPLYHWGAIPWLFYIIPAVAYGYMMHIQKRNRQTISESLRPILKNKSDGVVGKFIDILSVFVLLLGTSTTFSVATPLLSRAVCNIFGVAPSNLITVIVLIVIALIYTTAVLFGFKGISVVSNGCIVMCVLLAMIFFIFGNTRFMVDNTINALGNVTQNFIRMTTWTDPTRHTNFPQDWTVFYWAYWIAWSVANPFFIAKISEGRSIRNVVIGGTASGVVGTIFSFSIFGGYGIAEQSAGRIAAAEMMAQGADASEIIVKIIENLPVNTTFVLILLALTMIGFYSTTFDSLTHVISTYSYKKIGVDEEPGKFVKIFWSLMFILIPCALIFTEGVTSTLQGLSIIGAFPFSIITIFVIISFFKEVRKK